MFLVSSEAIIALNEEAYRVYCATPSNAMTEAPRIPTMPFDFLVALLQYRRFSSNGMSMAADFCLDWTDDVEEESIFSLFFNLIQTLSFLLFSGHIFTPNLKRHFGFSFCIKTINQGCCSVRKSVGKNTMNLCKEPWIEKFWRKRDEKTTNRDDVLGVVCLINRVIGMTNYDTCKYFNHHNLLIRNLQFTFNWQKIKENGDAEQ